MVTVCLVLTVLMTITVASAVIEGVARLFDCVVRWLEKVFYDE